MAGQYIKGIQHYAISKAPEIRQQTKIYTLRMTEDEKGDVCNSKWNSRQQTKEKEYQKRTKHKIRIFESQVTSESYVK